MITYKSIRISGNSGEYYAHLGFRKLGPFAHISDAEEAIDERVCDFDDENIYGLASMRQSIEEDRKSNF